MTDGCLETPLGRMSMTVSEGAVTGLRWGAGAAVEDGRTALLEEALAQLAAYFDGRLTRFDLPLRVEAGTLTRAVCEEMRAIPFGETSSYGEIARRVGAPAQAVGQACGANPIPVIIPCHRVLSARGLGGFSGAGGVESKVWLLRHEGAAGLLI